MFLMILVHDRDTIVSADRPGGGGFDQWMFCRSRGFVWGVNLGNLSYALTSVLKIGGGVTTRGGGVLFYIHDPKNLAQSTIK